MNNIFDDSAFTEREWSVLIALFKSSAPLTVDEVKQRSTVKMAWETCESVLKKLYDDGFVEQKIIPQKKKTLWSIDYKKKQQLHEKYFKKK